MISRRLFIGSVALRALAAGKKKYCGIDFQVIRNGKSDRRYLFIHGDETTAREVLLDHMTRHKGTAFLVENAGRMIQASGLTFDPNRMFTQAGLERNLKRLNPNATEADRAKIHQLVGKDREKLLAEITPPNGGLLTVLHNNSRGYSMRDELKISNDAWQPHPNSPTEFMLFSNADDFRIAKQSSFNAVLQNEPIGDEDGSLSRLAAFRKIRYVNIDVALGHDKVQREMMDWVEKSLP